MGPPDQEMPGTRRPFSAWLVACGSLIFLTVFEWVKPQAFLYDDNLTYFLPAFTFNAQALSHGVIPQINFFQYLGEVWLSDPQRCVFYPPIYLAIWLAQVTDRPGIGLEWLCWIHLAGAAVVMERFLRLLGSNARESVLAALLYLTLPIVTCPAQLWVNVAHSAFYLSLVFLTLERLCYQSDGARLMALAGVKALFLYSGNINFFALTLLFEISYLLLRVGRMKALPRLGVAWIISNFLALLWALPAIGPVARHLGESAERATVMPLARVLEVHVDLSTFLAAQFQIFRDQNYSYQAAWLFLGGSPFVLPLLLYGWRQPQVRRFGILTLAALLLSTPLYVLIHFLPGYGAFRWPAKLFFFCGFFYTLCLAALVRTLPSRLPSYFGVVLLFIGLTGNLLVTLGPWVRNGAEAYPRYTSDFHLPLEQLRDGRTFLVALSGPQRFDPDYLGFDFATLARVPAFAGYEPLIAAQNKHETLEIVFIGLPWQELDAETIKYLRSWSVRYYFVDPLSLWVARFRAQTDFKEWSGYTSPFLFEDRRAAPFAFFEEDPQRALPISFKNNELIIEPQGRSGTLSLSLAPLPGYTWSIVDKKDSCPIVVKKQGRLRIESISSTTQNSIRICYHEPGLKLFLAIAIGSFLICMIGLFFRPFAYRILRFTKDGELQKARRLESGTFT